MKALTFVEIDIDFCELRYGETTGDGTCPAVLGVDSPEKCYNTKGTCPVRESYQSSTITLRFAEGTAYLAESGIDAIACIESVDFTPGTISLGEDLGTRSSLRVNMSDFPWPDTGQGFDKYLANRSYDPYSQGTFWGKFRARHISLRGRDIRVIRGLLGQSLGEMETRHYVIDSMTGPTPSGRFTIVAKDVLKQLDGDRAQAPVVSQGYLASGISAGASSATLSPSGIGDLEYPSSGYLNIGGKEVVSYTRSGDTLTLTRAQYNTEAVSHSATDRVQLCLEYTSEDAADIIYDLIVNYTDVDASYINLADWQAETGSFLRTLYSTLIPEPTSVNKLISELIEQAALSVWGDDIARKIRLQVLRQIDTDAALIDESVFAKNSLTIKEQPGKRLSQAWIYFDQFNPLKNLDETDNFQSVAVVADLELQSDYGSPAIKKIYSRWIPGGGLAVATRVGQILIGRYGRPPREFSLDVFRHGTIVPAAGVGYKIASRPLQDAAGSPVQVPAQVTRIEPRTDFYKTVLQEFDFSFVDDGDPTIIFDVDTFNVNARETYDLFYSTPVDGDDVYFIINEGVTIGSHDASIPAFDIGSWPEGVNVFVINRGTFQAKGGKGGNCTAFSSNAGEAGGVALYTRYPIDFDNTDGTVIGGGGGGGSGGGNGFGIFGLAGGGGAGTDGGAGGDGFPEVPFPDGDDGTATAGGAGDTDGGHNNGGDGGGPAQAGSAGVSGAPGGAAGPAIDGDSYVTHSGSGTITGTQIN